MEQGFCGVAWIDTKKRIVGNRNDMCHRVNGLDTLLNVPMVVLFAGES